MNMNLYIKNIDNILVIYFWNIKDYYIYNIFKIKLYDIFLRIILI